MSSLTKKIIEHQLRKIRVPKLGKDIVSSGLVSSIVIKEKKASVILEPVDEMTTQICRDIAGQCEETLGRIPGLKQADVIITAVKEVDTHTPKRPPPPTPKAVPGIKHIIAVGAGKGGVGKSTVSVNLAVSLAQAGFKTGLLDADIYGPSVVQMMQLDGQPESQNHKVIPPERHGVKCMSMGLLTENGGPLVWRAPMALKALSQLMLGTDWGELDFLIVDLPPGTGDIQLSLVQNFALSGAVIVSTPQQVALLDVKKAIMMFQKVKVPILGLVENMSYFIDPASGNKTYLFGKGNTETMLASLDKTIPVLGNIPVTPQMAEYCDSGTPFVIACPDNDISTQYTGIASKILESV